MIKSISAILKESGSFVFCYLVISFLSNKLTSIKTSIDFIFYDFFTYHGPQKENKDFIILEYSDSDVKKEKITDVKYISTLIEKIDQKNPLAIVALLPSHDFSLDKKTRKKLCILSDEKSNLYFGVYDRFWLDRFNKKNEKNCNFFDAGTNRFFSQEILRRSFQMNSIRSRVSLSYKIAEDLYKNKSNNFQSDILERYFVTDEENNRTLLINYSSLKKTKKIPIQDFLDKTSDFTNKIVILGNKSYRKRTIHHRESSHVNTPWQKLSSPDGIGEPLLAIYPVTIENLLNNSFIRYEKNQYSLIIYLIIFSMSYYVWKINRIIAFIFAILQISFIILISFYFFTQEYILLDVTSMIAYSYLGSFIGSFHREKKHIKAITNKNQAILEKLNLSMYGNEIFSKVINETDTFIQKVKKILIKLLDKNIFPLNLRSDLKRQIENLSANTQDSCNYLKVLEIGKPSQIDFFLVDAIKSTLETLSQEIRYKKISVITEIDPKLSIRTDEILFRAVLYNILSNAVKHTFVKTKVSIQIERKNKKIYIKICDQGPGFKREIFEDNILYYNNSKKEDFYSSSHYGLGLYLSYLISKKISLEISLSKSEEFNSIVIISLDEI